MIRAVKILCRILFVPTAFIAFLVVFQDALIFPGAVHSYFDPPPETEALPPAVESFFVTTEDSKRLETWFLPREKERNDRFKVAIVFHGNGGTIRNFFPMQRWLAWAGMNSYAFDYRGFGNSSGWPSEKGLSRDGQAVWDAVLQREQVQADEVLLLGISIGTGFAAEVAARHQVGALVLLSPYSSLTNVVKDRPLFTYLTPLLRYSVPTTEYVSRLNSTSLLIAHGTKDTIILPYHSKRVADAYQGRGLLRLTKQENAAHNDLFWKVVDTLTKEIDTAGSISVEQSQDH